MYGHKALLFIIVVLVFFMFIVILVFLMVIVVLCSYHHGLVFFMLVMVLCSSWLVRCWVFFSIIMVLCSSWSLCFCVFHNLNCLGVFFNRHDLLFLLIIVVLCSSYLLHINAQFLVMANLLFINVITSTNLNRSSMVLFIIQRSLWQGCLLTPHLFIIMNEVFNTMVYKGIINNKLAKIVLFNFNKQKIYPINIWHQFHQQRWKTIFG